MWSPISGTWESRFFLLIFFLLVSLIGRELVEDVSVDRHTSKSRLKIVPLPGALCTAMSGQPMRSANCLHMDNPKPTHVDISNHRHRHFYKLDVTPLVKSKGNCPRPIIVLPRLSKKQVHEPVPPNFRFVPVSACINGLKSLDITSAFMPMPVSETVILNTASFL